MDHDVVCAHHVRQCVCFKCASPGAQPLCMCSLPEILTALIAYRIVKNHRELTSFGLSSSLLVRLFFFLYKFTPPTKMQPVMNIIIESAALYRSALSNVRCSNAFLPLSYFSQCRHPLCIGMLCLLEHRHLYHARCREPHRRAPLSSFHRSKQWLTRQATGDRLLDHNHSYRARDSRALAGGRLADPRLEFRSQKEPSIAAEPHYLWWPCSIGGT